MLAISVKDKGIGIPEELMPNLFNPLVKTSRPGLNDELGNRRNYAGDEKQDASDAYDSKALRCVRHSYKVTPAR